MNKVYQSFLETAGPDNIYFSSDHHWGHHNVTRLCNRPFSPEEQTQKLIDGWNSICNENSYVFHLGDLFWKNLSVKRCNEILSELNFERLFFIRGNHDQAMSKWLDFYKSDMSPVEELGSYAETKIEDQHIVMCHYPLAQWNRAHYGSWCLVGHSHGSYKNSHPDCHSGGKILDVGVDCHEYRPISYREVQKIMNLKKFYQTDHHVPTKL